MTKRKELKLWRDKFFSGNKIKKGLIKGKTQYIKLGEKDVL